MPTLPTITVTDAQYARLQKVFPDGPAYLRWLREQLVIEVSAKESRIEQEQFDKDQQAKRQALMAEYNVVQ